MRKKIQYPLSIGITSLTLSFALVAFAATDKERAQEIEDIVAEADSFIQEESGDFRVPNDDPGPITLDFLAAKYSIQRDQSNEDQAVRYMDSIWAEHLYTYASILRAAGTYDSMIFFIAYDFGTAQALGMGERAGVVSSWRTSRRARSEGVFAPYLEAEWEDILKIANGRWPSEGFRNSTYEESFRDAFQKIYLRDPNRSNPYDDAAIMTMAYGLRPEPRNLDRERGAIGYFKDIYGRDPGSTMDWDIVRAIAYSGAIR
jgi:hypothetical protein